MAEFDLDGGTYRTRLLNAVDQWRLLSRLHPLLPALFSMEAGLEPGRSLADLLGSLRPLMASADEDLRFVFQGCLAACEKRDEMGTWSLVDEPPGITDLVRLVMAVVSENYGMFFAMKRASFHRVHRDGPSYKPVSLPDGEDWLFRPTVSTPPLCTYRELVDGTHHITDVAKMNEILDVLDENRARAHKAAANG